MRLRGFTRCCTSPYRAFCGGFALFPCTFAAIAIIVAIAAIFFPGYTHLPPHYAAPGEDGLSTLVWYHLWPYVSPTMTRIFKASIDLGHYPQQQKAAKIVVLRKPGKPDYTTPSAYRPISLLNTLGKLLEAATARRLPYYTETHRLLPDALFGGRPGPNT
jgi:hypothetical protein